MITDEEGEIFLSGVATGKLSMCLQMIPPPCPPPPECHERRKETFGRGNGATRIEERKQTVVLHVYICTHIFLRK